MTKSCLFPLLWFAAAIPCAGQTTTFSICDVNQDGSIDVADVQIVINEALGVAAPNHDLIGDGSLNAADVQHDINGVLGRACLVGTQHPTVALTSPVDGAVLTNDTPLTGTVQDSSLKLWRVEYHVAGATAWIPLVSGTSNVVNGPLGTLAATLLANDTYRLRLYAEDSVGSSITPDIGVTVNSQQLKMGDFTLAFTDLRVPGMGFPISISRNYDTKRLRAGDFGIGWMLGFTNVDMRVESDFSVFITLPDGKRTHFLWTPSGGWLFPVYTNGYTAEAGTYDQLENLDCPSLFGGHGVYLCGGFPYNPQSFRLTTRSGIKYTIAVDGGISRIEDPNGNWMAIAPAGITTSQGVAVTIHRDAQGRVSQITDPAGRNLQYAYDAKGNLSAFTDADGNLTTYFYQSARFPNYLTTIHDPLNRPLMRNVFDDSGRLVAQCDANGDIATLNGCLKLTATPASKQYTTVNGRGYKTDFFLDNRGNVLVERHWIDNTNYLDTVRTFDPNDNLLSIQDPQGNTWSYTYDAHGNRLTSTDSAGRTTTYTYDSCNKVASLTDPAGNVAAMTRDTACNLISIADTMGAVTQYTYNSAGQRTAMTDAAGNTWQWTYDENRNPAALVDPFGKVLSLTVNESGDIVSRTDRNGNRVDLEYDGSHRLVRETWNTSPPRVTSFTYDALGQMTLAQDPDSRVAMSYDSLGNLVSIDNAGTPGAPRVILSYTYDADGNVATVQDSLGGLVAYTYDALDRVIRVTQSGAGARPKRADIAYDTAGMLTGIARFSDLAGTQAVMNTAYQYECGGCGSRLSAIRHRKAGGNSVIDDLTFTRDTLGRILTAGDLDGSHTYTYDKLGRLLTAAHSDPACQSNEFYTYDPVGNRLTSYLSAAYTYTHNRLTQDDTYAYAYDDEGNLVKRLNRASGAWTEYAYDFRKHLKTVIDRQPDGTQQDRVDYTYDALGRRLARTGAGATSYWIYDGLNPVLQLQSDGTVAARRFYTQAADGILAEEAAGSTRWLATDNVGSVRDLVDDSGTVQGHLAYSSFGTTVSTGGTGNTAGFRFDSRESDGQLAYFRGRYYDSNLGRFTQEEGFPSYGYVFAGNNPLSNKDPLGRSVLVEYVCAQLQLADFARKLGQAIRDLFTFSVVAIDSAERGDRKGIEAAVAGVMETVPQVMTAFFGPIKMENGELALDVRGILSFLVDYYEFLPDEGVRGDIWRLLKTAFDAWEPDK